MIRQYRLERFNGVEMLVSEVFLKHTWTQLENDSFFRWKEQMRKEGDYLEAELTQSEFRSRLGEALDLDGESEYYGLSYLIPVYDVLPHVILRGVVVDNRIASLQVEYTADMLSCQIQSEIRIFYEVMDSRHWRDMVSHQIEKYGSLFTSPDDKESE